eukprot:g1133.t1
MSRPVSRQSTVSALSGGTSVTSASEFDPGDESFSMDEMPINSEVEVKEGKEEKVIEEEDSDVDSLASSVDSDAPIVVKKKRKRRKLFFTDKYKLI